MNRVIICLLIPLLAGCASAPSVPPLSESGVSAPGKFVWRDLLTPNPSTAQAFYGELFGWEFEPVADTGYSLVRSNGDVIAGLVDANRVGDPVRSAVWINAISVPDIASATKAVRDAGGRVIRKPHAVPARGKVAVAIDQEGAVFQLIQSYGGDPVDTEPALNGFLWVEMIANDPEAAAAFYRSIAGYDIQSRSSEGSMDYRLLLAGGTARGGIVANPFEDTRSAWVPFVRVEDPGSMSARAAALGGKIVVEPREEVRHGTVALILDPSGAPLVLQKWSPVTEGDAHE